MTWSRIIFKLSQLLYKDILQKISKHPEKHQSKYDVNKYLYYQISTHKQLLSENKNT
jgi:hypothetical protein